MSLSGTQEETQDERLKRKVQYMRNRLPGRVDPEIERLEKLEELANDCGEEEVFLAVGDALENLKTAKMHMEDALVRVKGEDEAENTDDES